MREINRIEQRIRIEEAGAADPDSKNRDDLDKEVVIDAMNLPKMDASSGDESEETVEMVKFDSIPSSSMELSPDETPKGLHSLQKRLSVLNCHLATLEKRRDEQTSERETVFQRNETAVQRCLSVLSAARLKLELYLEAVQRVFRLVPACFVEGSRLRPNRLPAVCAAVPARIPRFLRRRAALSQDRRDSRNSGNPLESGHGRFIEEGIGGVCERSVAEFAGRFVRDKPARLLRALRLRFSRAHSRGRRRQRSRGEVVGGAVRAMDGEFGEFEVPGVRKGVRLAAATARRGERRGRA